MRTESPGPQDEAARLPRREVMDENRGMSIDSDLTFTETKIPMTRTGVLLWKEWRIGSSLKYSFNVLGMSAVK